MEAQFFALRLKFLWFITDLSEFKHELTKQRLVSVFQGQFGHFRSWPFLFVIIFFFFQRHVMFFDAVVVVFFVQWHFCENRITEIDWNLIYLISSLNWDLDRCCSQFKTFNKIKRKNLSYSTSLGANLIGHDGLKNQTDETWASSIEVFQKRFYLSWKTLYYLFYPLSVIKVGASWTLLFRKLIES